MVKINNAILTKVCIIGFLFSFLTIYYIESNYIPPLINIENISSSYLNKHITIEAEVISQRKSLTSDTVFLWLKDNSSTINTILFNTNQTLNKNQLYTFEGKVDYYQDSFQLIIKNIYS